LVEQLLAGTQAALEIATPPGLVAFDAGFRFLPGLFAGCALFGAVAPGAEGIPDGAEAPPTPWSALVEAAHVAVAGARAAQTMQSTSSARPVMFETDRLCAAVLATNYPFRVVGARTPLGAVRSRAAAAL